MTSPSPPRSHPTPTCLQSRPPPPIPPVPAPILFNPSSLTPPRPAQAERYDPKKSRVSDDTLVDFLRAQLTGDLTEIPGIGPAAVEKLAEGDADEQVTNSFQLVGKFLLLKGPDVDGHKVESVEHMDRFWHWLASRGVSSYRSGIVNAVAEKMNTMMPGIYDADA